MPMTNDQIRHLRNDQLARAGERLRHCWMASLTATAACFVAGVWVDWRWFPTSVVPAALFISFAMAEAQTRAEAVRRLDASSTEDRA